MYDEMSGLAGWMPSGDDVGKAAQGTVGLVAGATVAKLLTTFVLDFNLKKEKDASTGVVTYKFKVPGTEAEATVVGDRSPEKLDAGRGLFGGTIGSALPGLLPVAAGLAFYAKGQSAESDSGRVWMTSSGLGMLGYGLGYIVKSILERVDVDYSTKPDATNNGAYTRKSPASPWATTAAAYIPFGAVDTYESNIVINGLGYAGPVRGYMRGGYNGLGYSRSAGAPTFVQNVRGLGRAPAEIQTLAPSTAGFASAPSTAEIVNVRGLSSVLM